jgi:hypothetical protein
MPPHGAPVTLNSLAGLSESPEPALYVGPGAPASRAQSSATSLFLHDSVAATSLTLPPPPMQLCTSVVSPPCAAAGPGPIARAAAASTGDAKSFLIISPLFARPGYGARASYRINQNLVRL